MDRYLSDVFREKREAMGVAARRWLAAAWRLLNLEL